MSIYGYEEAFGAWDKTSKAMRTAIDEWFSLYYEQSATEENDPCQRIGYSVVNKLVKTIFGEYQTTAKDPATQAVVKDLDRLRKQAVQLALVGGECYIKPCPGQEGFSFTLIPRNNVLIFGRDADGVPTDLGTVEKSAYGNFYYTLLERRTVDAQGYLTIENRLYRSSSSTSLGKTVPLSDHPGYGMLPDSYRYPVKLGSVGLARMKTPMLNCVDGSPDGVSVYAPAVGLIRNIGKNEAQLGGEFSRGESRIIVSADLLNRNKELSDHLFVGLDEDPERVGITTFAPQLREKSYIARKQEYLRDVESMIGLKRGSLSDAYLEERTATAIESSAADYNLTILDLQGMWEEALCESLRICSVLADLYKLPVPDGNISVDWGNGVLYDEDRTWEAYQKMVTTGLLKPEIALGWRFNMPTNTKEDLQAIRNRFMPDNKILTVPKS